jgi:hypothetical protein
MKDSDQIANEISVLPILVRLLVLSLWFVLWIAGQHQFENFLLLFLFLFHRTYGLTTRIIIIKSLFERCIAEQGVPTPRGAYERILTGMPGCVMVMDTTESNNTAFRIGTPIAISSTAVIGGSGRHRGRRRRAGVAVVHDIPLFLALVSDLKQGTRLESHVPATVLLSFERPAKPDQRYVDPSDGQEDRGHPCRCLFFLLFHPKTLFARIAMLGVGAAALHLRIFGAACIILGCLAIVACL